MRVYRTAWKGKTVDQMKTDLEKEDWFMKGNLLDPWDSETWKELEQLLSSPFVDYSMLESEVIVKTATLLTMLRFFEENGRKEMIEKERSIKQMEERSKELDDLLQKYGSHRVDFFGCDLADLQKWLRENNPEW